MNQKDKIQLGANLLKALVHGAARARQTRAPETAKQNANVSGCGGCSRSTHK
jgi:hypothetical protein